MKNMLSLLAVVVLLSASAVSAQDGPVNVGAALKKLDATNHTSAEIKAYAREIKGRQAEGSGSLVDVLEGRRDRHRVTILASGSKPDKGYNVVLYTTMNAPADLKKGQSIRFMGEIGRVSTFRGTSVDIHGDYTAASRPAAGKKK